MNNATKFFSIMMLSASLITVGMHEDSQVKIMVGERISGFEYSPSKNSYAYLVVESDKKIYVEPKAIESLLRQANEDAYHTKQTALELVRDAYEDIAAEREQAIRNVHQENAKKYAMLSGVSGLLALSAMACAAKAGRDNNGHGVQEFIQAQRMLGTASVVTALAAVDHACQAYPEYTISSFVYALWNMLPSWKKVDGNQSP